MSSRSIRANTTAVCCLAIFVYLAVAWLGLVWYARHSTQEEANRSLEIAATGVMLELGDADSEALPFRLAKERREFGSNGVAIALIQHKGKAVDSKGHGPVERSLIAGKGWQTKIVQVGRDMCIIGVRWDPWAGLKPHLWALLALSLSLLMVGATGSWILVERVLSPIALLSDQANAASADTLRVRLRQPSADSEIVRLVATLNGLLSRLSDAAEAKGLLYSAASHELRTPLQALSGHLELALHRDRSKEDYKQIIEEAYRQTRRLILLVGDLLLLYQLESGTSRPAPQPDDLTIVCRQTLASCQPIIEQRGLRVLTDLPQSAEFLAPSTHAHVLVRNLMENAAKYAEQGSEITVDLSTDDEQLELRICNRWIDPSTGGDHSLAHGPFQPDHQNGGTGLGLAICQAIAEANSWRFSVETEEDGVCAVLAMDFPGEESPHDSR